MVHRVRKVGHQPPDFLLKELERKHPTVRLLWNHKLARWALVDAAPGQKPALIRLLQGPGKTFVPPTLANTVYFLDTIHPGNLHSEFAIRRFLKQLDESETNVAAIKRGRDAIQVGSNELWRSMNRKMVRVP